MSERTPLMCVGAPAAAPVRAIDLGLSTGQFGSQRRGREGNSRPQQALWPPALISIPIRKVEKSPWLICLQNGLSFLFVHQAWLTWVMDGLLTETPFVRRGVTLLRSGSLRRLLSVHLRMKEKTTPVAPFRHNLGSRRTALFRRGQKPDAFRNTLSLKWGTFSLPEASGISSQFQMLSFSCSSRSVDYPAEAATGYFSFRCTSTLFFFKHFTSHHIKRSLECVFHAFADQKRRKRKPSPSIFKLCQMSQQQQNSGTREQPH